MKGIECLGFTGKDRITGFEGIITGYVSYITGCNQFLLTPKVKDDGTGPEARWIDEQRIVVIPSAERVELNNGSSTGPDMPAPIR